MKIKHTHPVTHEIVETDDNQWPIHKRISPTEWEQFYHHQWTSLAWEDAGVLESAYQAYKAEQCKCQGFFTGNCPIHGPNKP